YFVNGIVREAGSSKFEDSTNQNQSPSISTNFHQSFSIPYSFVSSLEGNQLADNEIILTQWAADDLKAKLGDSIKLEYLEIGPLRQLIDKENEFILKEIVPMTEVWADPT